MRKLLILPFFLITLLLNGQSPVISAKDFAAALKADKSMVVLDVNGADVYGSQHIQGAINLFHKELYKVGPVEGQLKTTNELAAIFAKKGITDQSRIVLYDEGSNRYNSKVWWILKYLGATNVSILHFNMDQFAAARIPLTATPTAPKPAVFNLSPKHEMACAMSDLQKLESSMVLLDGREKDEFEGKDVAKRSKGHIPGAVWMNYKEVLTPTGAFKSKDEIVAAAAKFGATPDKQVYVYCQTGIKASVLYIALKEIAGFPNVKNYIGAFAEWASIPENSIAQ